MRIGWRVFGMGVAALGLVDLAWGNFDSGQPVSKAFPERMVLAYVASTFMVLMGAAAAVRRTSAWGAAAITAYFGFVVAVVVNGRVLLSHYEEFGAYSGLAEQLAIAAGGLIVFASSANLERSSVERLTRLGQAVFGICALLFGGAHFFYMEQTAPLVPRWLPPSQEFWGYATGIGHVAAGLSILTAIRARLAAFLLTMMYASFTVLVHVPLLLQDHSTQFVWSENALNLALIGTAWVVLDSLSQPPPRQSQGTF